MAAADEIINSFKLERGRHGTLLGREDVLAELDALLLGGSSRGWVLVKGGPGLGKSALLAEWLRRREAAGHCVPHHFLRRGVEDWDRPEVVKRNLAVQVEALYPELADPEAHPESRLSRLLLKVSNQVLEPRQQQLVLVVDGLDEVEAEADGSNPLPSFLPHVLPPGVRVLCASRPTYPYLSWLEARDGVRTIDLDHQRWTGSNRQVVREYWERASSRFNPSLASSFVDEIVQRAEGNVLYSVKLAEWLETQPAEERRAELLPRGLEALLEESWEHLQKLPTDLRELAEQGLGAVAVAREALPRSILSEIAGWEEGGDPERFLRVARPFLLEEAAPGSRERAWRPHHESFRSFVLEKLGAERERELHSRLARHLCQWPVGAAGRSFRWSYGLRHGVTHWLKAEQWEQARELCTDMGYLEKMCQEAGVLAVEEALKGLVVEAPERERSMARALQRAIQAGAHVLRKEAKALPLYVYNWLRCRGWDRERLEKELKFPDGLPALRLRHPVKAGGHGRTLEGHGASVIGCAVTPDGRHVVSASWDKTLKVWEWETGQEVATLQGHRANVNGCAVTLDGRHVVSASWDGTLKVWDISSGKCLHTLYGFNAFVSVAAGSATICAGDVTGNVWVLETGSPVTQPHVERTPATSLVTPMNFTFPPPLLKAYRSKKLALWVGSGLSLSRDVQGNFPRWDQLPLRLLEACERQGVPDFDAETLKAKRAQFMKRMGLEVMLAELGTLSTALGRGYQDALNDIFRPANAAPGRVHEVIAQLEVSPILTTNYDLLIEELRETPRRHAYTWKEANLALNDLKSGRRVLFKIHGTAERHDTVVLTEREYDRARSDKSYQSVLSHLLQEYTVLFLGYGMNDPFDIDLVLKWNAEVFNAAAPRHFALLKDPSGTDVDRYLREHNVQTIPYSDYAALPGILEALRRAGAQPP